MNNSNPKSVSTTQGVVARLREIRCNDMGATVTYYFDDKLEYLDFQGNPANRPIKKSESGRTWVQVTQINREIFYDQKGKKADLIELAHNFSRIAWDLGAFKFEI